jgi:hypothetical protein
MYNKKLVTAVDAPDESSLSWVMLEHFLSMSIDAWEVLCFQNVVLECRLSVIKDDAGVSYAIVAGDGNGLMWGTKDDGNTKSLLASLYLWEYGVQWQCNVQSHQHWESGLQMQSIMFSRTRKDFDPIWIKLATQE